MDNLFLMGETISLKLYQAMLTASQDVPKVLNDHILIRRLDQPTVLEIFRMCANPISRRLPMLVALIRPTA